MSDIFFKLLNMSITAGWLVLAALLFRICFKKSPKWIRCVLWAMVAVRLVLPFTVKSDVSVIPSTETVEIRSDIVNESSENILDHTSEESDGSTVVYKRSVSVNSGIKPIDDVLNSITAKDNNASRSESKTLPFYDISGIIWLIGACLMMIYALASFIRIKRQVRSAVSLEKNIMLCDGIYSSFILGIFRPRIYLPASINEEKRKYMIAHETAHLKRRDHLWKPLGFAILSVYWFNPVIWLAYILLCRDIELACDEKVIKEYDKQNKADYLKVLVECSVRRTSVAACPLAFGGTGVKERVVKVLNYKKPAFRIIFVSLIACAAAAVLLLTDPKVNAIDDPASPESAAESTAAPGADESETYDTTAESRQSETTSESIGSELTTEIETAPTETTLTETTLTETTTTEATTTDITYSETKTTVTATAKEISAAETKQSTKKYYDDFDIKNVIIDHIEKNKENASKGIKKEYTSLIPERTYVDPRPTFVTIDFNNPNGGKSESKFGVGAGFMK